LVESLKSHGFEGEKFLRGRPPLSVKWGGSWGGALLLSAGQMGSGSKKKRKTEGERDGPSKEVSARLQGEGPPCRFNKRKRNPSREKLEVITKTGTGQRGPSHREGIVTNGKRILEDRGTRSTSPAKDRKRTLSREKAPMKASSVTRKTFLSPEERRGKQ